MVADLTARLQSKDTALNELRLELTKKESDNKQLREDFQQLFTKIETNETTKQTIAYFDATVRSLDAEYTHKHSTILGLKEELQAMRSRLNSLTTTLTRSTRSHRAKDLWMARVRQDVTLTADTARVSNAATIRAHLEALRQKYAGLGSDQIDESEWEKEEKQRYRHFTVSLHGFSYVRCNR